MILAGTGHRPNKLNNAYPETEEYDKLICFAQSILSKLKPAEVISGMALGWDMALADAAICLEIPFIAAVPFKGQESVWPEKTRILYRKLLSESKEVYYVCGPGYDPWKMMKRNVWMVDELVGEGDTLLALWNGDIGGGTYNAVNYAVQKQVYVLNVWNDYLEFIRQ